VYWALLSTMEADEVEMISVPSSSNSWYVAEVGVTMPPFLFMDSSTN